MARRDGTGLGDDFVGYLLVKFEIKVVVSLVKRRSKIIVGLRACFNIVESDW